MTTNTMSVLFPFPSLEDSMHDLTLGFIHGGSASERVGRMLRGSVKGAYCILLDDSQVLVRQRNGERLLLPRPVPQLSSIHPNHLTLFISP